MSKKVHINMIKTGDQLYCSGFTCIPQNAKRTVFSMGGPYDPEYFITCDHGHHFLNGQTDIDGNLIGISYEPFSNSVSDCCTKE